MCQEKGIMETTLPLIKSKNLARSHGDADDLIGSSLEERFVAVGTPARAKA